MSTETKKKEEIILNIFVYLHLIFCIIFALFGPKPFSCSIRRIDSRLKECMANCRIVIGAIEMYNLDNKEDYNSFEIPLDPVGSSLEGYYKPISKPTEECYYYAENEIVFCIKHGYPGCEFDFNNSDSEFKPGQISSKEDLKKVKEVFEIKKREDEKKKQNARRSEYIEDCIQRFSFGLIGGFLIIILPILSILAVIDFFTKSKEVKDKEKC